ncbi:MAG: NusG domain II-containing protein [Bacillota bacterium]|nr:NusG domain II-containing protein [Bacillota bacterium]
MHHQRWYHWLKWGDWLLYAVIGCLAIALLFTVPGMTDGAVASAVFTQDGDVILTLSAEQLLAGGSLDLDAGGYHYLIVYEAGRIRFAEADCPDKVCVRTGWISRSGQIAACVPGRLIIKIVGGSGSQTTGPDDVDVIVG